MPAQVVLRVEFLVTTRSMRPHQGRVSKRSTGRCGNIGRIYRYYS
jgi:hypothetical protein